MNNINSNQFNTKYKLDVYSSKLTLMAEKKSGQYLAYTPSGLNLISRLEKIWEELKGLLGFNNATEKMRVNSYMLSFINYGIGSGYLKEIETHSAVKAIYSKAISGEFAFSPAVKNFLFVVLTTQEIIQQKALYEEHLKCERYLDAMALYSDVSINLNFGIY